MDSDKIKNFTIITLEDFVVNTVKGTRVLIVAIMSIPNGQQQPDAKIGEPVPVADVAAAVTVVSL